LGAIQPGDLITTPKGEKLSLKAGYNNFSGTFHQGIYQRSRGNQREWSARNLQDTNESDLRAPAPIELRGGAASVAVTSVLFSCWPYLLIATLVLLVLEWFVNPRMAGWSVLSKRLGFWQPS